VAASQLASRSSLSGTLKQDEAMPLEPTLIGRSRLPTDGCRRYRVTAVTFDTRPYVLGMEVNHSWEDPVKEQWQEAKRGIREAVLYEFGVEHCERKLDDFQAIGAQPWSVVAMHNRNLREIRRAFVAGAYYPALLGAVGLGERILNQVVLELRDAFADHPATKQVAANKAFDDWKLMIRVLKAWQVLPDEVAKSFGRLRRLRHDAVHYNMPTLDTAARDEALEALQLLQGSIERLFHPSADAHLIPGIAGAEYLRHDVEEQPFVRRFFIPASVLVSPEHEWVSNDPVTVLDNTDYGVVDEVSVLSDEEFAERIGTSRD
jgi:hypothetical protein